MRAEIILPEVHVKPALRPLAIAFFVSTTLAATVSPVHADLVLRVTLEGWVDTTSAPQCPGEFCWGDAFTLQFFIDQINIERVRVVDERDGSAWDEVSVSYNVRSWMPPTNGMFSVLPPFDASHMRRTTGITQVTRYPRSFGEFCCTYLNLSYNDGLNFVEFDMLTHQDLFSGGLDPWYGILPRQFEIFNDLGLSSPTTGPVVFRGAATVTEIAPVPEPGTLILLGAGLTVASCRRKRPAQRR